MLVSLGLGLSEAPDKPSVPLESTRDRTSKVRSPHQAPRDPSRAVTSQESLDGMGSYDLRVKGVVGQTLPHPLGCLQALAREALGWFRLWLLESRGIMFLPYGSPRRAEMGSLFALLCSSLSLACLRP